VAYNDPQRVCVDTESMAMFKSTDGGITWTHASQGLGPMPNATVIALWVDPAEDDRVYAMVGYWLGISQARVAVMGTYVTVNGAASWQLAGAGKL